EILGALPGDGGPTELLAQLSPINTWLLLALMLGGGLYWFWLRQRHRAAQPTWGCGYARPTPRMQYTACSFAAMLAEQLLPRFLRPRARRAVVEGLFPSPGEFRSASPDPITEQVYRPLLARCADRFAALRVLQQGKTNIYLAYILITLILGLAWATLRGWW